MHQLQKWDWENLEMRLTHQ